MIAAAALHWERERRCRTGGMDVKVMKPWYNCVTLFASSILVLKQAFFSFWASVSNLLTNPWTIFGDCKRAIVDHHFFPSSFILINLWLTARVKFYLSQENKCSHSQLWDMACWVSITIIKRFILVITLKVFDCHLNLFLMKACDRSSWVGSSGRHHCCHHSPPEEQHHHQPRILTPVSFLSSFIQFSPTLMFIYI